MSCFDMPNEPPINPEHDRRPPMTKERLEEIRDGIDHIPEAYWECRRQIFELLAEVDRLSALITGDIGLANARQDKRMREWEE